MSLFLAAKTAHLQTSRKSVRMRAAKHHVLQFFNQGFTMLKGLLVGTFAFARFSFGHCSILDWTRNTLPHWGVFSKLLKYSRNHPQRGSLSSFVMSDISLGSLRLPLVQTPPRTDLQVLHLPCTWDNGLEARSVVTHLLSTMYILFVITTVMIIFPEISTINLLLFFFL